MFAILLSFTAFVDSLLSQTPYIGNVLPDDAGILALVVVFLLIVAGVVAVVGRPPEGG